MLLLVCEPSTSAVEIWTDIGGPDGGRIAKFDSANPGVVTYVGLTGQELSMDGLDFTSDGTLYGVIDQDLYVVDQETGWATLLGTDLIDPSEIFFDLSWDPVTQAMYAIGCPTMDIPKLYQIDLTQHTATFLGRMYGYPDTFPPGGLATTATGVRYTDGYSAIYRLGEPVEDPNDPWVPVERLPRGEGFTKWFFGGMTIDWSRDGVCYHATVNLDSLQTELWTVNLQTGRGTLVGGIGADPSTTILLSAAIKPVPEPGAAAMVGGLLLLCGRRRFCLAQGVLHA